MATRSTLQQRALQATLGIVLALGVAAPLSATHSATQLRGRPPMRACPPAMAAPGSDRRCAPSLPIQLLARLQHQRPLTIVPHMATHAGIVY